MIAFLLIFGFSLAVSGLIFLCSVASYYHHVYRDSNDEAKVVTLFMEDCDEPTGNY